MLFLEEDIIGRKLLGAEEMWYVVTCYRGVYLDKVYYTDSLAEAREIAARNVDYEVEILWGKPGNYWKVEAN